MIIAIRELLDTLEQCGKRTLEVKCAVVGLAKGYHSLTMDDIIANNNVLCRALLKEGWDNDDWIQFLQDMNFNYEDGYGSQGLYGVVWFKDGTWLEREEYDGLEWWVHQKQPTIPEMLRGEV